MSEERSRAAAADPAGAGRRQSDRDQPGRPAQHSPPTAAPSGYGQPEAGRSGSLPPRGATRVEARPAQARGGTRRLARLAVKRIDPWSVFTTALMLSLFLGIVLLVAVFVLYGLLDGLGVVGSLNDFLVEINLDELPGRGRVLTVAAVVAAVDVVLLTVLATVFAVLYNLVAMLTGGIELTLTED